MKMLMVYQEKVNLIGWGVEGNGEIGVDAWRDLSSPTTTDAVVFINEARGFGKCRFFVGH